MLKRQYTSSADIISRSFRLRRRWRGVAVQMTAA